MRRTSEEEGEEEVEGWGGGGGGGGAVKSLDALLAVSFLLLLLDLSFDFVFSFFLSFGDIVISAAGIALVSEGDRRGIWEEEALGVGLGGGGGRVNVGIEPEPLTKVDEPRIEEERIDGGDLKEE